MASGQGGLGDPVSWKRASACQVGNPVWAGLGSSSLIATKYSYMWSSRPTLHTYSLHLG